jgi:hypothetical protein
MPGQTRGMLNSASRLCPAGSVVAVPAPGSRSRTVKRYGAAALGGTCGFLGLSLRGLDPHLPGSGVLAVFWVSSWPCAGLAAATARVASTVRPPEPVRRRAAGVRHTRRLT